MSAASVFKGGIVLSKLVVTVLLLVYAYRNLYTSFVTKNPAGFLSESILYGAATAIPFFIVLLIRQVSFGTSAGFAFAAFMTFFFLNVIMEFSGQNAINQGDTTLTDEQKEQLKKVKDFEQGNIFKGSVLILGLVLIILALFNQDTGPGFHYVFFESLIIGFAAVLPSYVQAKNRGSVNPFNRTMLFHFVLFTIGHFILQLGGFYTLKNQTE